MILLDLGLPDSTGLATVVSTKKKAGTIPIVVLTGFPEEAVVRG